MRQPEPPRVLIAKELASRQRALVDQQRAQVGLGAVQVRRKPPPDAALPDEPVGVTQPRGPVLAGGMEVEP
jgi:hypothetical protein